jgi:hypothetical protein
MFTGGAGLLRHPTEDNDKTQKFTSNFKGKKVKETIFKSDLFRLFKKILYSGEEQYLLCPSSKQFEAKQISKRIGIFCR